MASVNGSMDNDSNHCIINGDVGTEGSDVHLEVARWVSNFNYQPERLTNAFTAAAYLTNQAWIDNNDVYMRTLTISYDLDADTQIPVISRGGLIAVSIMLGLDILILLPLAVYASRSPRWTAQLDSFVMMRMGAAVADKVPLLLSWKKDKIKALDEIPGWIGDQSENTLVGKLSLGGAASLTARKNLRFECYEGDHEQPDYRDKI
jgi:hypothetical protein